MHDHELRRLVAQLAGNRDEDIRAVLASLDSTHRTRISGLLAEHAWPRNQPSDAGPPKPEPSSPDLTGLSAWLTPRIEAALRGESEGTYRGAAFALGPAAREALAAEARLLAPAAPLHRTPPERRARSLFRHLRKAAK